MRFNIKKVTSGEFKGKWVAMDSRGCFFEDMVGDTKEQARVNALMDRARKLQSQMDEIHAVLVAMDAVNPSDPYGYLA
jgi:hypothetical protein